MRHAIRPNRNADRHGPAAIVCALALSVLAADAFAQGATKMPVPFQTFTKSAANARFEDYAGKAAIKVRNADEFQKMKAHVVSTYQGVKVRNSFVLGEGNFIDCVDMKTQPALRRGKEFLPIKKSPAPMIAKENKGDEERKGAQVAPMLSAGKKDAFGNAQYCSTGFIPMHRITLDELVRYETLGDFFSKYGKAGEKGSPEGQ